MDQESLDLQTELSRNRITDRNAKGLVGRVYLIVFVDDKKDVGLAEKTFSILVNPD